MASIFELLDEIRQRPGMYVGWDESRRALQLQALVDLLNGYHLALRQHGIHEPVANFSREFGEYLWETREWSASRGPIAAIREAAKNDEEAWELLWSLVDEFRRSRETR